MEENTSLNVHTMSEQIIGELPSQMEWVYGVSDILIISLVIGCIIKIFLVPLELFKR